MFLFGSSFWRFMPYLNLAIIQEGGSLRSWTGMATVKLRWKILRLLWERENCLRDMHVNLWAVQNVTYFQNHSVGNNSWPWWNKRKQPFYELILLSVWANLGLYKRVKSWRHWKMQDFQQMRIMLLPWWGSWMQTQKTLFLMDISGTSWFYFHLIDFEKIPGDVFVVLSNRMLQNFRWTSE